MSFDQLWKLPCQQIKFDFKTLGCSYRDRLEDSVCSALLLQGLSTGGKAGEAIRLGVALARDVRYGEVE